MHSVVHNYSNTFPVPGKSCVELLKTIAISTENYQTLKNMGGAGDSFNDVITHLIKKAGTLAMIN